MDSDPKFWVFSVDFDSDIFRLKGMKSGFGSSERWSGTTRNGRFLEFFKQWGFHQQSPKQTHTDILYVSIGVVPNGFLDIDLAS